jgi:hypothetical protein
MNEPKILLNPKKRTWREFAEMHIFEASKCDIGLFKRQHFNSNQNSASSDDVSIKLAIEDSECIEKVTSQMIADITDSKDVIPEGHKEYPPH